MKLLSNIREFFWPLLENGEVKAPVKLTSEELKIDDVNLEKALEFTLNSYKEEEDRKATVESKSSLFIGTISVVTTIIIGITSFIVKSNEFSLIICSIVLVLFILTLYMIRTIWFSIKALERKAYHTINSNDFLTEGGKIEYYKKMITEIINKININSQTINKKVDNMTMAQEYFKRAIVVIAIYSFFLVVYFLIQLPIEIEFVNLNFINQLRLMNLNVWIVSSIYLLILISLVLNFILFRMFRKK